MPMGLSSKPHADPISGLSPWIQCAETKRNGASKHRQHIPHYSERNMDTRASRAKQGRNRGVRKLVRAGLDETM